MSIMYIKVKVHAGAKREEVTKVGENSYRISVRPKAERNQANERVREIFADLFGISVGKIRIINGRRSPNKLLSIEMPGNLV